MLFDHKLFSLKDDIERCFGKLKVRFPSLKQMPNYLVRKQRVIPIAFELYILFIIMSIEKIHFFFVIIPEKS